MRGVKNACEVCGCKVGFGRSHQEKHALWHQTVGIVVQDIQQRSIKNTKGVARNSNRLDVIEEEETDV